MLIRRCSGLSTRNSPPRDQNAWPPRLCSGSCSTMTTRRPASASSAAATSPARPAPTTTASASVTGSMCGSLPAGELVVLLGVAATAAEPPYQESAEGHDGGRHRAALTEPVGDLLVGAAGQEPRERAAHAPHDPARRVVEEEAAVAHPAQAGQARGDRPEESGEAAEEDGGGTAAVQEGPGLVDPVVVPAEQPCPEQPRTEALADLVADRVADDRGGHHDHGQGDDRQPAGRGDEPGEQHGGLAGEHEAEEHRRLTE